MAEFTDSITVRGEDYDYDPVAKLVLAYCENCGFGNEVEVDDSGDEPTFYSFSCVNCGHFNTFD